MLKLSMQKKLLIIRLYLSGLSYAEIASKANVSTGTVANIVAELKAGQLPGIEDIADQVEALRELAVVLNEDQLTPVQAVVGLTVLSQINELGLEPKHFAQVAAIYHDLAGENGDAKAFMAAAINLEEVKKKTGLSLDELDNKVKALEESAAQLEPLAKEEKLKKEQIAGLEAKKQELADEVSALAQQQDGLKKDIALKVQHNDALAAQAAELEEKAHAADVQLASAREDLKTLAQIGLSAADLSTFTHEIKGIASHHSITPAALGKRLHEELIKLDKALGLEATIKAKQGELLKVKSTISEAKKEKAAIKASNDILLEEQSGLKAGVEEAKKHITDDLDTIHIGAQEAMANLKEALLAGMQESLQQVASLKDKALELGTELGKLEGLIDSSKWLKALDALIKGEDSASSPSQIRVIAVTVTRALSNWLSSRYKDDPHASAVQLSMSQAASRLEDWMP